LYILRLQVRNQLPPQQGTKKTQEGAPLQVFWLQQTVHKSVELLGPRTHASWRKTFFLRFMKFEVYPERELEEAYEKAQCKRRQINVLLSVFYRWWLIYQKSRTSHHYYKLEKKFLSLLTLTITIKSYYFVVVHNFRNIANSNLL